ncbi:MAG TPA: tetratricopeptide repeat protein, partial [Myxococcales bacterium]|nr:tetratricopeptide repeat protein [Myxococcales bacterium]
MIDRLAASTREQRWGEAFRLASWLAWREPDAGQAAALWRQAADIAAEKLGKPSEAERCLARLLELCPNDPAALAQKAALAEAKGAGESAARLWEALADADPARRAGWQLRAADVWEARAGSVSRAVICLRQQLAGEPHTEGVRQRLFLLFLSQRRFEAAASLYSVKSGAPDGESAESLAKLGTLLLDEPIDHALARQCLERAVQLGHGGASDGLRRLSELAAGWAQTIKALRATAVEERDRRVAARLYLRVAQLHSAYDPQGAAGVQENLQRCFLLWPGMPEGLETLERLAKHWRDPSWAVRGLEALAASARDRTVAAELWERGARLLLLDAAGRTRSVTFLEKACELDPSRPGASWLLAELLIEEGQPAAAAETLEKHLERAGNVAATETRLFVADLRLRKLRDPEGARAQVAALVRGPTQAPPVVRALAEVCERLADAELLGHVLEMLAEAEPTAGRRLDLLDRVAELEEGLGRTRQAFRVVAEALWLDPADRGRAERLERLSRAAELRDEYLAALEDAFDVADGADAIAAVGMRLATALGAVASRAAEAPQVLRRILEARPGDVVVTAALDAALLHSGATDDLEAELARRLPATSDPQARQASLRELAKLREARKAAPQELAEIYRELSDMAPADAATLHKLWHAESAIGDWEGAARAMRRLLALEGEPARATELRQELAALVFEKLHRPSEAVNLLREILAGRPGRPSALRLLERIMEEPTGAGEAAALAQEQFALLGDWTRAAAVIDRRVSGATDASERARLRLEQSRLQEERLADRRAAFTTLCAATREGCGEVVAADLIRLAEGLGLEREACGALLDAASSAPAPEQSLSMARAAAKVAAATEDGERFLQAQQIILELVPDDPEALSACAQQAQAKGKAEEAVGLLRRQLAATKGKAERAQRWRELGRLLGEQLSRPAEAAAAYRSALEEGADPLDVLGPLAAALLSAGSPREAAEALVGEAALWEKRGDAARAARARLQKARIQDQALGASQDAVAELREILARRPNDPEALDALESMLGGVARREAAEALVAVHERNQDPQRLVQALETLADSETDPAERAGILRRIAQVQAGPLREPALAFATLVRAVRLRPRDLALRQEVGRLATGADLASDFALLLEELTQRAPAEQATPLFLELGRLWEGPLRDPQAARSWYHKVIENDPGNREALEAMHRLAGSDPDEVTATAEALALATDDPDRRLELLREAAAHARGAHAQALWTQVLATAPEDNLAKQALEQLFDQEGPDQIWSAGLLSPIYRRSGDAARLLRALEVEAASKTTPRERLAAWSEVAELAESLGQEPAAFAAGLRALREAPGDFPDHERLAKQAVALDAVEELASLYEELAEQCQPAAAERSLLLERAAGLQDGALNHPERAAELYAKLLESAPQRGDVVQHLVDLHRRLGRDRDLADLLQHQARLLSPEPARKKELLFEAAALMEGRLVDQDGAMGAYREILSVDPRDPAALEKLGALLGAARRWDEVVQLFLQHAQQAATAGDAAESRALLVRAGVVRQQHLGDPAGALQCLAAVLQQSPEDVAALAALEELAGTATDVTVRAAAAQALEPSYRAKHNLPALAQALQMQADAAVGPARSQLLLQLAGLYADSMEAPEMAFVAASQALKESPEDAQALQWALTAAERAGVAEELAGLLSELSPAIANAEAARRIHWALARLYEGPLGDAARAAGEWRQVLELAPDDDEAFQSLQAILSTNGDHGSLLELLRRQLAVAEDVGRRVQLLHRIGAIQESAQQDPAGAFNTYRRLVELAPEDRAALATLERLCMAQQRWPELAPVLEQEARLAGAAKDGPAQAAFLFRLGQLDEGPLRDPEAALALYRAALEAQPGHPETVARLEAILAADPRNVVAAELLEGVHQTSKDWPKYAAALDARASATPDPQTRRDVLLELARVREKHQGRADLAFIALCRAFRDDPADPALRAELERVGELAEAFEELIGVYEEELERNVSPQVMVPLMLKVADLLDRRAGDSDRALTFYEKAHEIDARASASALPALERIYRQKERWDRLADVLDEIAASTADPIEQASILFRLGQLAEERLGAPDRAARAYEALLERDRSHLPTLRALERLYEQAGRGPDLFSVLERQRELTPEGQARDRIVARMADVASAQLHDDARAADLWKDVLTRNPRLEAAQVGLEGVLERLERWQELADLLQGRLKGTVDPREITRLNDKLGWVQGVKLGKADDAAKSFRAVLERDPKNRRALEALRDIHQTRGEREELAGILRRLIPLQEDATGVKAVRLQLAQALAGLGRREEAVEAARRALDLEPHQVEELVKAEAIFRELSAWQECLRAMDARAELLAPEKPEEAIATWFEVADLHAQALKRPEGGAPALEKILDRDPGNDRAAEALEKIYGKTGDWRRYAALLDKLSHQAPDPAKRLAMLRHLAEIQEQRLGQKDMAFLALCRAFQLDAADPKVAEGMRRLARETGALEELVAVYETVAETVGDGPSAEQVHLTLARIQDEDLDDPDASEASLRKWLTREPASLAAVEQLGALFRKRGRAREHALALEQKVNIVGTLDEKKVALRELARCYDEMGDTAEAVGSLQRGLELDSGDAALTQELASLFRREKAWPDLVALLQRARDQVADGPERAALQLQIAEITEQGLGDDEAAISAYRMALELDPSALPALGALERLYSKLDRAAELLRVYDRLAELSEPRERVKVLLKAALVWEEKLANPVNAIACLEGVVALDPKAAGALRDLERLYRQTGDGEHLALTLQRRLSVAQDAAETVALHVSLGEVWGKNLGRPDQAEALFQRALQIDPNNAAALHALGELCEQSGKWPQALEMIGREARLATEATQAVDLHHRAGRIFLEKLEDPARAASELERALEIDPAHLPSLRALKALYEKGKDDEGYMDMARREAEVVADPAEKTELYYSLGKYHQDVKEDVPGAERCYLEALRWTPDHLSSARPLADIYQGRSDWENAEKMLDIVVAAGSDDPKDLCRYWYRLGYVADKRERQEKALDAYRRAYELDATYLPALEGLGHLLVQTGRNDEALKIYQAILIHHRDDLTDLEVVEIYWQIGTIHRAIGQGDRAQKDFEKALELDPSHEPSHQALVELFEEAGRWDAALEHRQRLLDTLEGEPRFVMCIGMAKLARDHLADPYQAIDAYLQALKILPDSREALESLLALYLETKQSQKAVEVLEKLIAVPAVRQDARALKGFHFKLAQVYRDEIKDDARAMEHFNLALDADPTFIEAFAALETMLSERRAWPALEQAYHAMIKRLPKTPETQQARLALWRNLGELYRRALRNVDGAITAYEVVSKGDPADGQVIETLADLYASKPGLEAKAIEAHRAALRTTAQPARNVKALAGLHAARKEFDEAYITSQVAVHLLGDRDPDEEQVVERLKRFARETATRPMTDRLWTEHLYHERLRGPMAEVLSICQEATGGAFAVDHGRLNVNPKRDRVDVASSMLFFVNMYKYVARTLSMEAHELFKVPGAAGLALGNSWPICFLAGEDMFKDRPKKELWFAIAKAMAFSRPELAMARLHPREELEAIFQAALYLAVPSFRPTADPGELQRQGRKLEKGLSEAARPALFRAARECLKDPNQTELRGYIEAVEHTANRAGILLCADVEVAKRCLARDPGVAARLPERSKVR